MSKEYRVWESLRSPGICTLSELEGYSSPWNLIRGKVLGPAFETSVRYHMNPSSPRDVKLADCLLNMNYAVVVSKAVAQFLRGKELRAVEYLPVSIVNH